MTQFTDESVITLFLKIKGENNEKESTNPKKHYPLKASGTLKLMNTVDGKIVTKVFTTESEGTIEFAGNDCQLLLNTPKVTKDCFTEKIIQFLQHTFWRTPFSAPNIPELIGLLGILYDRIQSFDELLILVSETMYATVGFRILSQHNPPPKEGDKWYARGLLYIHGEENYERLAELTQNPEFINNPDILESYDPKITEACVTFWKDLIEKRKAVDPSFTMDFDTGLKLMFPKFFEPGHEKKYAYFRRHRFELYKCIVALFEDGFVFDYFKNDFKSSFSYGKIPNNVFNFNFKNDELQR
ncbi:hypothetical protein TUBRATIS_24920 [Tubulinosema ratisbonensis]|uniref:Uncharacterized protein n=1 Tax=Tubulinosema ratisbonensis TaxID=291195 RepID=A0A437AIS9_9MICR|nr:hypothetical protein TUBRATIS_24920 [Tubulinosema ratisbonensis]